jgi:hypothetical protein
VRPDRRRGARPLVASLAVSLLGVAGCSGSSASPATPQSPAASATTPAATATEDAAAARAVTQARTATQRLHRYAFSATTRLGAAQDVTTRIDGRVVRGSGLAYRLVAGGQHTEVVRLRHATFVRKVPGRWHRLHSPRSIVDPTGTLVGVLRGIRATELSGRGGDRRVRGTLAPDAARRAGLPPLEDLARVELRLDRDNRVTALEVRARTAAGSSTVALVIRTTYRFGHLAPVRRPV